jgi:hypothetical protein
MALLLSKQRYKEYALLKTIIYYYPPDQRRSLYFQKSAFTDVEGINCIIFRFALLDLLIRPAGV